MIGVIEINLQAPLLPFVIGGPVLALLFCCALPWLIKHTDFLTRTRDHLRRFAPLYLVAGPPAITYFALCGTLSVLLSFAWILLLPDKSREGILESGIFGLFHAIEWACSIVGAFAFAWLLRWLRLPRFWFGILFLSFAVSAVYRTARNEPGPKFNTGPAILFTPEPLDMVPVALGFALFAIHVKSRTKRSSPQDLG